MQENKGLTGAQILERNQNRFQATRIDGEMFQVMNQSQDRLQHNFNLQMARP